MAALRCFLGRLSAGPARSFQLQSPRFISSSSALWSNSNKEPSTQPPPRIFSELLKDKTGVTGPAMLGVGVSAYLISKELYVVNSETVIAVVMGSIIYYMVKKYGGAVAEFLDSKSEIVLKLFTDERNMRKAEVQDALALESQVEKDLELRHDIFEVLKENNAMRLEEEYRRRLHLVTDTVRRQLDYQVDVEHAQRKFEQEHMVQWLEKAVKELVEGKQDESLAQCMNDLKKMATA